MEESQDIITHLKFIGRVRQGEKINVKHLFVQPDGLSTRISRTFINIDSRNNTLSFINNTVKKAVDFINLYKNSTKISDLKICNNISKDLLNCKNGLTNLKLTYSEDTLFCCNLDTILESIESHIEEFSKHPKLNVKIEKVFKEEEGEDEEIT